MESVERTDFERGLYVEFVDGERLSFGFISRQLGNDEELTLSDLRDFPAWKNGRISAAEKERLMRLFGEDGKLIHG